MEYLLAASNKGVVVAASQAAPQMDVLMLFGFLAAFFTLVIYLYRRTGPRWMLMLAVGLAALAMYGFMTDAWALGLAQCVTSAEALRRWRGKPDRPVGVAPESAKLRIAWPIESRMTRVFNSFGLN